MPYSSIFYTCLKKEQLLDNVMVSLSVLIFGLLSSGTECAMKQPLPVVECVSRSGVQLSVFLRRLLHEILHEVRGFLRVKQLQSQVFQKNCHLEKAPRLGLIRFLYGFDQEFSPVMCLFAP